MIGEELGLGTWASLIVGKERLQRTLPGGSGLAPFSEEETKKQMLTKMLVEVYINSGKGKTKHAAKILNAQAINLEVGEVRLEYSFRRQILIPTALRYYPWCHPNGP
jgi:hypothetical protein